MITGKVGFASYAAVYPAAPKYSVVGADSQVVEIQLQPGETIKAEPGVMMHMHPQTKMEMELNLCVGANLLLLEKAAAK